LFTGLDAAGKTTILYKLKLGNVVPTIPTTAFNVETVEYKNISFNIWDLGGRCHKAGIYRHYYHDTQALVLVVDSSDRDRIEDVHHHISVLLGVDALRDVPLLVYANKQDLANAMSDAEIIERPGLRQLTDRQWFMQTACAYTGDGLSEGLDWLCRTLSDRRNAEDGILLGASSTVCKAAASGFNGGLLWLQQARQQRKLADSALKG
jgi:ADP-ribosylation factor protein 1